MAEVLRVALGALVAASLAVLDGYVLIFFAVVVWTLFTGSRRDPLAEELDEILAEILRNTPTTDVKPSGRS